MSTNPVRTFAVGEASVSLISIGDVTLPLAPAMELEPADLVGDPLFEDLARTVTIPLQDVLIRTADATVLVDAGLYDVDEHSEYYVPGHVPPPGLVEGLTTLGVAPDDVDHVVITHRHWDHFNGLAIDGSPTFPRARHWVSATDWAALAEAMVLPGTREARSVAVVHREGLLELVEGDTTIAPGVTVVQAPGETRGHQIVRVESGDPVGVLYAVGDLYHHPAELVRPDWMVRWADRALADRTRSWFLPQARREEAILIASHVRAIGTVGGSVDRPEWIPRHA